MLYVLGRGTLPKTYLVQLNPKPLSCILISWVEKGQFEERGYLVQTQSPTMKIMIVVKDPKKKKTLVYVVCGFEYN